MTNEEKILELLGTMQGDLNRVNDRLERLEAAQEKMQEDLDGVKEDLGTVKTTQAKMEVDLTRVRTMLEVDVDRDIRALINGHTGLTEQLRKLDEIEEKLEKVSIRADSAHAAAVVNEYEITQLKQAR